MNSQKLPIHNLELQLYTWGNPKDPLLLCLHGWLDTGAGFHWLAESLLKKASEKKNSQATKQNYFIVAPDLRGYGKSQHSPNPLGYFFFEYVADVKELTQQFSPQKPFMLLGHSLGGAVASAFAGVYPERVSHLINLEGFGFQRRDGKTPPQRAREWLEAFPPKPFPLHQDFAALAKRLQGSNPRLTAERALFLAKHLGEEIKGGVRMAADPTHRIHEPYSVAIETFYAFWQAVTAKSLFVDAQETEMKLFYGEDEFENVMLERRKNFPPSCRMETLLNCGHMMHHEKPEALAELIGEFLD